MSKELIMKWLKYYPECRRCKNMDIKEKHYSDYYIQTECVNKFIKDGSCIHMHKEKP